jgi:hypothetical protein
LDFLTRTYFSYISRLDGYYVVGIQDTNLAREGIIPIFVALEHSFDDQLWWLWERVVVSSESLSHQFPELYLQFSEQPEQVSVH